jgi:histidinol-phosphate aminotransferase
VVAQYSFAIYPIVAKMFGAEVITVPAKNYGHDLPAMLAAITPRTRIVFVTNPNNPTGTRVGREELIQFVNAVPENVLVALDEAYLEFLDDAADLLSLVRSGARKNLILLRTFSKIYGLAGLRIGYGIAAPELIAALEKIRQPFNANLLAQTAAIAALDDEAHLRRTRQKQCERAEIFHPGVPAAEAGIRPVVRQFHPRARRRRISRCLTPCKSRA